MLQAETWNSFSHHYVVLMIKRSQYCTRETEKLNIDEQKLNLKNFIPQKKIFRF